MGVLGKLKSTGDGGGAGVSLMFAARERLAAEALKAALTSWPRVEFVMMDRRVRGLKAAFDAASILADAMWCGVVWSCVDKFQEWLWLGLVGRCSQSGARGSEVNWVVVAVLQGPVGGSFFWGGWRRVM